MRIPLTWLREFAPIPAGESGRDVAARLVQAGLEVETVDQVGAGVEGDLVVGRVDSIEELTEFKKPIRFCRVSVGAEFGHLATPGLREIICGARNFEQGDLVVVAVPGSVLPGGFQIASRETYGRISDGMICSEKELGIGDGHDGILRLAANSAQPGDAARPLLGIGEEVLDIAVTPDRGYALSVRGVAREAATAYGVPFVDPGTELVDLPVPSDTGNPHPCESYDHGACDVFTLRTLNGFNPLAPVPSFMAQRLFAAGMRSVSLAVDITNYVMLETGQPLHAFDQSLLRGPIQVRRAAVGESLETLDHVIRELVVDDLVIADDRGPVGLAGLMGGMTTEIGSETTHIVLEAAHFDANVIARMSRRHKLSSEASRRFERGVDRELPVYASARAVALLLKYGGGSPVGMTAVETVPPSVQICLSSTLPGEVAGMTIAAHDVARHLRSVGCTVTEIDATPQSAPEGDEQSALHGVVEPAAEFIPASLLNVAPPSWRPDLTDPSDLVEEVLRLIGYDQIPSVLPIVPPQKGWTQERKLRRRVGLALAGAGYVETPAYPFIGATELDALQLPQHDRRRATVRLANPISDEQPFLRTSLLPGLFAAAKRNLSRGAGNVALFENGSVFFAQQSREGDVPRPSVSQRPTNGELASLDLLLPDQPRYFAALLAGAREPSGWWGAARESQWADAIAAAGVIGRATGVTIASRQGNDPSFHPGRCAELLVGDPVFGQSSIGHAGELHPRVIEAFGLPARTCVMELDFDRVVFAAPDRVEAHKLNTMPVAKEDVALVVDRSVSAADVADALRLGGGELLESIRLFDEYTGDQLPPDKKSLAFALRFRAQDRTLKAEEVAAAREAAVSATTVLGATLRA